MRSRIAATAALIVSTLAWMPATQAAETESVACWDGTPVTPSTSSKPVRDAPSAARFLEMATFGPTWDDIAHLQGMNQKAWLREQFRAPRSCHFQLLQQTDDPTSYKNRNAVWWRVALTGPDQLRQRVAFALSEIFVVSGANGIPHDSLAQYYDILGQYAFGNFRDLLELLTLHPAMGQYLSMRGNQKPDPVTGIRSDENYAREIMQLFTIGLVKLNVDGTPKLDASGKPIPTYTQTDIENMARVLTGWNYAGTTAENYRYPSANWLVPMEPVEAYHDTDAKTLFDGIAVPAGGSARSDLKIALDALFNHANTAPFISRQLIQRLVTSNPTPAFVARIARVFENNGRGVRGDLQAVVKAILLDEEAQGGIATNPNFARLREPLLVLSHVWRALDAAPNNGYYGYWWSENNLGQSPLSAPSVFNFFRPDFAPNGGIKDAGLVGPEFQLANDAMLARAFNEIFVRIDWYRKDNPNDLGDGQILVDLAPYKQLAIEDPAALVDQLDLLFTHGSLPQEFKDALIAHIPTVWKGNQGDYTWGLYPAIDAITLIVDSPYYLIFR